jgi:hypothetical protein
MLDKLLYASYAIGSPIIKYGKKGLRLIKKTTPKPIKKFSRKSTKFIGKEFKSMKHFAKTSPELFAGGATIGVGLGTGIGATINAMRNGKKKKNKRV